MAVLDLTSEILVLSKKNQRSKTGKPTSVNSPDVEQHNLNCNIVIRGAEVTADAPESKLLAVYSGLRSHLGVIDVTEFDPVSVKAINTNPADKNNTSVKPIRVQFQSVDAKSYKCDV